MYGTLGYVGAWRLVRSSGVAIITVGAAYSGHTLTGQKYLHNRNIIAYNQGL